MLPNLRISDYSYNLPEERIAKHPLAQRDTSKLLYYNNGQIQDLSFGDVPNLLPSDALLVFNNTRVVQARILFEKTAGAKPIEVFCLEPVGQDVQTAMAATREVNFVCLVGNAKRWNDGLTLTKKLDETTTLSVEKRGRQEDAFDIRLFWNSNLTFAEVLELAGRVPLPPYLNREIEEGDRERYQTVYAKYDGSVAAPTAGLHFTTEVLTSLVQKGVLLAETTLHVGAGTFKPVSTEHVQNHQMHAEEIHVKRNLLEQLLAHNGPVYAVGTTSTRTLESLYWMGVKIIQGQTKQHFVLGQWDAYALPQNIACNEALAALLSFMDEKKLHTLITYTSLIIAPSYKYRVLDALFTNFHQPGSTLLLLIAAALGEDWRAVYNHALENGYRFLSYGDSNLYIIPEENKVQLNY
jgi:S-adenosylmethionine:tRNA ribosyltransferase-isomerase